jgi:hypothetical protein
VNVDDLVRDSFHEQVADLAPPPVDFADRVLAVRRRRRTRTIASAAVATAAAVAVAVAMPVLGTGKDDVRPANVLNENDIIAHPGQTPPRDLIAAGGVALAAYYTETNVKLSATHHVGVRTYWLLDARTRTYEKTKWSFVAVAPGLRTAAVLERTLPAKRIGLLNLLTGKVERWIPVDHTVGAVAFSPDGRKLVATTYKKNPDLHVTPKDGQGSPWPNFQEPGRTGFYVVDVASGEAASWNEVSPGDGSGLNDRQDFGFSHDGKLVYTGFTTTPGQYFYDFRGYQVQAPANEKHLPWYVDARLSPDGRRAAGDFAGGAENTASAILDPVTGRRITTVRGQELLAWVDNKRLIAWDITPGSNEFHNRLVVVALGSDKEVPLSGFRGGRDGAAGRWTPVFARR